MEPIVQLHLIDSVSLTEKDRGEVVLESPPIAFRPRLSLHQVTPALAAALRRLREGQVTAGTLVGSVVASEGSAAVAKLQHYLQRLESFGMLERTLLVEDLPLAALRPVSPYFRFLPGAASAEQHYVLSRFASARNERGVMLLESPLGHAELRILAAPVLAALLALTDPRDARGLAEAVPGIGAAAALALLGFLVNARAAVASSNGSRVPEDDDPVLAHWASHDMLFHTRSRLGRHADPYGGTFPFHGRFDPPPVTRPPLSSEAIPLHRPSEKELVDGAPFGSVLENRISRRRHGDPPIDRRQLGEFLFRTARVKRLNEKVGVSFRPSPGAGALHALEIYPVVHSCAGIDPGFYHYDPLDHALRRVEAPEPVVAAILNLAGVTAMMESSPQVLMLISARFQRMQNKYQSVAYAAILKDVGCLYQTMYLVATEMGLAPCALGGGHSDLFSQATGIDYFEETTVGEFVLGSAGTEPDDAGERWHFGRAPAGPEQPT